MFRYTDHRDIDAPQYVHADVASYDADAWMIYYKHHRNMDAPQYVHVDVHSGPTS